MNTQAQAINIIEARKALRKLPVEQRLETILAEIEQIDPIYYREVRAASQRSDRLADDMERRLGMAA